MIDTGEDTIDDCSFQANQSKWIHFREQISARTSSVVARTNDFCVWERIPLARRRTRIARTFQLWNMKKYPWTLKYPSGLTRFIRRTLMNRKHSRRWRGFIESDTQLKIVPRSIFNVSLITQRCFGSLSFSLPLVFPPPNSRLVHFSFSILLVRVRQFLRRLPELLVLYRFRMLFAECVRVAVEIGEQEVEEHHVGQNKDQRPFRIVAVVDQQLTTVQECQTKLTLCNRQTISFHTCFTSINRYPVYVLAIVNARLT